MSAIAPTATQASSVAEGPGCARRRHRPPPRGGALPPTGFARVVPRSDQAAVRPRNSAPAAPSPPPAAAAAPPAATAPAATPGAATASTAGTAAADPSRLLEASGAVLLIEQMERGE